MSELDMCGVFPPVPTPFDTDGNLSVAALQDNLTRWSRFELAGFVVLGSNGEAATLDEKEKLHVLQAAREALPADSLLIAGTGCESTRATIALTRRAARAGADAAMVVTPWYYHPLMSVAALSAHFRAVADASPIPVLLYNVPHFTGVDMGAATVVELSTHRNIIGIKDSSGSVAKIGQIVQRTGKDFFVLTGAGAAFFPALTMGASGGILALANLAPAACVDIFRLHAAGDWEAARELQARLIPLNSLVSSKLGPPGVKAALDLLGYYGGPVRPPLLPPSDGDRAALRATLAEAGLHTQTRSYTPGGEGE
jgi:4-hydroxy-2-oxoglutarate aldolase